jgi:hypothetical protein
MEVHITSVELTSVLPWRQLSAGISLKVTQPRGRPDLLTCFQFFPEACLLAEWRPTTSESCRNSHSMSDHLADLQDFLPLVSTSDFNDERCPRILILLRHYQRSHCYFGMRIPSLIRRTDYNLTEMTAIILRTQLCYRIRLGSGIVAKVNIVYSLLHHHPRSFRLVAT